MLVHSNLGAPSKGVSNRYDVKPSRGRNGRPRASPAGPQVDGSGAGGGGCERTGRPATRLGRARNCADGLDAARDETRIALSPIYSSRIRGRWRVRGSARRRRRSRSRRDRRTSRFDLEVWPRARIGRCGEAGPVPARCRVEPIVALLGISSNSAQDVPLQEAGPASAKMAASRVHRRSDRSMPRAQSGPGSQGSPNLQNVALHRHLAVDRPGAARRRRGANSDRS